MKTAAELNDKLAAINGQFNRKDLLPKEAKKLNEHYKLVSFCRSIVEAGTTEESLKQQLQAAEKKLQSIENSFSKWLPPKDLNPSQALAKYNTLMGKKQIENHIQTLKYILA